MLSEACCCFLMKASVVPGNGGGALLHVLLHNRMYESRGSIEGERQRLDQGSKMPPQSRAQRTSLDKSTRISSDSSTTALIFSLLMKKSAVSLILHGCVAFSLSAV